MKFCAKIYKSLELDKTCTGIYSTYASKPSQNGAFCIRRCEPLKGRALLEDAFDEKW